MNLQISGRIFGVSVTFKQNVDSPANETTLQAEEITLKRLKAALRKFILLLLLVGLLSLWWINRVKAQPIPFDHALHAGARKISCVFCHTGARKGDTAGVPSVQDCMQCHQVVLTDNPDVQKLQSYWKENRSIEWFKVYNLPEHVRFSHQVHLVRGFSCENCHGDVARMTRVKRANTVSTGLNMGQCVGCHRRNQGSDDCTICHK